jgi:predicted dehydrogenase
MTASLRAGVLGLGMMGQHHVRVLRQLPGVDLVAAADPGGDPLGAAAFAGVPVYDGLDQLLSERLDFCVIAVPTEDHAPAALQCADAGVPVLIEKPLAADVASGAVLVRTFEAAGLVAGVGHIERYNPALQSMRLRLQDDALGDIYQVATRRQGPFPDRVRDVGVVKDLATHDLDLTSWVTQSGYSCVSAQVAFRAGRAHEDLVAVVGQLQSEAVTSHLVNWLTPTKERTVVVTGDRGCFVADTLSADLTFFTNAQVPTEWDMVSRFRGVSEGDMVRYAIAKREPLSVEMEAFCAAIRDGDSSRIVSLWDGLRTLIVAETILTAARSGTVESVPEPSL